MMSNTIEAEKHQNMHYVLQYEEGIGFKCKIPANQLGISKNVVARNSTVT
jgi:hypothetical protein